MILFKGGFATVYLAIWKDGPLEHDYDKKIYKRDNYKEVALKCINNSQNITKEFLDEIKAYSIKKSHNIVKIYGISQEPITKNYVIILQYDKYGSIIICDAKRDILHDIMRGLREIHQRQMVHRDFHIGNILFTIDNNAKCYDTFRYNTGLFISVQISDMGLCGEVDNTNKSKIFGVTPYVAPEVLRGKPYTQAADIYSFGMIMYFTLTGSQPFENRAHDSLLALDIYNRPNIELINSILDENYHNYDKEFGEAEKCFNEYKESNQLTTTHSQAVYTSQLLNPYTEGLAID
ncbi:kinase-like domain-containing protein [Rhizophagus diaphanus]|nr:kinase-like domain-containing protein [Rhizophagus diaphanus] [Rhizophagus sp. MUCL 43196]